MNNKNNMSDIHYFGDLERYLYGGSESYSYFNRNQIKCNPLSQSQHEILKRNGTANFGYSWFGIVNNNKGDYLTNCWLHVVIPEVKLSPNNIHGDKGVLRWTDNLLHNLIDDFKILVNDRVIYQLNNFSLDLISQFSIPEDKFKSYTKNIGNIKELTTPNTVLPSKSLFLPLPLFFSKDSGLALPLASIPHTEIKFNFSFKDYTDLLIFENKSYLNAKPEVPVLNRDILVAPFLEEVKLFGEFINVGEEERKKISIKNRSMIFEQVQTSPRQMVSGDPETIDLLFKHSIKTIFFAVRNCTFKNVWSNYKMSNKKYVNEILSEEDCKEIIKTVSIKYDEKYRVENMPAIFFRDINSWYHSNRIPTTEGVYNFNFCLDQNSIEPSGGISLSRISSPSINFTFSKELKESKDNFELIIVALSNNILQISEGVINTPFL